MGAQPSQLLGRELKAKLKAEILEKKGSEQPTDSRPAPSASKVRQWLGDTAVLGRGGSYTVGGGTSQEARGLYTTGMAQPRPSAVRPARGRVCGGPEGRVKAAWLREVGEWECASSPRKAGSLRGRASHLPLLSRGQGERQSAVNK